MQGLFDGNFLLKFSVECIAGVAIFAAVRHELRGMGLHYFSVLIIICAGYMVCVGIPNLKRFIRDFRQISLLK